VLADRDAEVAIEGLKDDVDGLAARGTGVGSASARARYGITKGQRTRPRN
jgi:hypothetical protein